MVICHEGSRDHLVKGVAYRVTEVIEMGPGDWLVGVNVRKGMLFGAWRFEREDADEV